MRGLEEGHGLSQKDVDILKNGFNAFFVAAPKYPEMEEFRRVIKFILKSNILNEGHGLGQKDLDTLESLRNQIEQGTLDSKKQDEFVKVLDFLIKSNILQDKTKDLSKGKVDENLIKEFIGGETEKMISAELRQIGRAHV